MRLRKVSGFIALAVMAGLFALQPLDFATSSDEESELFDFYVLSLSWSPSYCQAEGEDANPQQCGGQRQFAFVVHGLWPQYEKGYPSRCPTRLSDRVPNHLANQMTDIMPSYGLIGHQWRKHGTCSGLDQSAYFEKTREAFDRISIPPAYRVSDVYHTTSPSALEAEFIEANDGLSADGIAVTCKGRYIREVRICMTKDLKFRTCREVNNRACQAKKAVMPAARGR